MLLSNTKNTSLRLLIFLISILILFIIGSRAALFIYIFVCFLYFFKNISYFKLIWVFSILFISLIVFINYNEIDIENNRMFSVLNNLENDPSQIAREELNEFGVKDISNNIFLGNYANQYYTLNNLGSYMHNIISYYRQFGLVVFILIIFLLIYVTKRHFEYFILNYNKIETYVPYVTLFILIECLFLRSYNTAHFWLIFGLFANYTKGIK